MTVARLESDRVSGPRQGAIGITIARVGSLAASFLAGIVTARTLEPADRGALAVAISVPVLVAVALTAGRDVANLKHASDVSRVAYAETLRILLWSVVGSAGVATIVLVQGVEIFGLSPALMCGSFLAVPAVVGTQLCGSLNLGARRYRTWVSVSLTSAGLWLGLTLAIKLMGHESPGSYLAGFVASQVVSATLMLGLLPRGTWTTRERDVVREYRRTARTLSVPGLVQFAMLRVPVPLVAVIGGSVLAAELSIGLPLVEVALLYPVAVATSLQPHLQSLGERDCRRVVSSSAVHTLLVLAGPALVLGVAATWLVTTLYGTSYEGAATVVRVALPAVVAFAVSRVCQTYFVRVGRLRPVVFAALAGLVLGCIVIVLLTPSLGLLGASLGVAGAYLAASLPVLASFFAHRLSNA